MLIITTDNLLFCKCVLNTLRSYKFKRKNPDFVEVFYTYCFTIFTVLVPPGYWIWSR